MKYTRPRFQVGWPPKGTPAVHTVKRVCSMITWRPDYPDEVYWLLAGDDSNSPSLCLSMSEWRDRAQSLLTSPWSSLNGPKEANSQSSSNEEFHPLPYSPAPSSVLLLLTFPDSLCSSDPLSQPDLLDFTTTTAADSSGLGHTDEPFAWGLCTTQSQTLQLLFHEALAPAQVGYDGTELSDQVMVYYKLFSTIDLLNLKHHIPTYSAKPQALMASWSPLFISTNLPRMTANSFSSCSSILRHKVLMVARKWLQGQAPARILDSKDWSKKAALSSKPEWDWSSEKGRAAILWYWEAILRGIWEGVKRPSKYQRSPQ